MAKRGSLLRISGVLVVSVICVLFSILSTDTVSVVSKNEMDWWLSFQPMADRLEERQEDDQPIPVDSLEYEEYDTNEMDGVNDDLPLSETDDVVEADDPELRLNKIHSIGIPNNYHRQTEHVDRMVSDNPHPLLKRLHPTHTKRGPFRDYSDSASSLRQERARRIANARKASKTQTPYLSKRYSRNLRMTDPSGNKVLFFVHIHKSAGTSLCQMAHRHRLRTLARRNCNVQRDQRCCGREDTVEAQIRFANKTKFDFVAIEKEMYESMAPDYYHYIVILRKSESRYLSHYNHVRRRALKAGNDDVIGTFQQWFSHQPDNWNTRILCGPRCLDINKYQLTREIFQHTLNRLKLFEDIMFLEDMENSYKKFTLKHAWPGNPMDEENAAKDAPSRSSVVPDHDWDPLMSALDDALYEYGQRKEAGLEPFDEFTPAVKMKLDEYFLHGVAKNCTTVCCADRCSLY